MPTFNYHHLHLPHYHVDNDRELRILYFSRALVNIVASLTTFFIPLFLFTLGQDWEWSILTAYSPFQKGILTVISYYLMTRLVALISTLPIVEWSLSRGFRFSFLVAHVLFLLQLTLLAQAVVSPWHILIAAISHGLYMPHYWLPHHLLLSTKAHLAHMGEDLGLLQFFLELSRVITPALGGVIIVTLGYGALFNVGIILLLASMAVTLFMKTVVPKTNLKMSDMKKFAQLPLIKRQTVTFIGRYFNDALIALWPVYVLLLLGAADKVGYLYSFSLLVALLTSLMIGFYLDHSKSKRGFFFSGGALGLVWLGRILAVTPLSIGVADTFDKLISQFHWLFYDFLLYRTSKSNAALLYFVYRELVISLAAIVIWLAIGLTFILIENTWQALFGVAAVGVVISTFMTDKITTDKIVTKSKYVQKQKK